MIAKERRRGMCYNNGKYFSQQIETTFNENGYPIAYDDDIGSDDGDGNNANTKCNSKFQFWIFNRHVQRMSVQV